MLLIKMGKLMMTPYTLEIKVGDTLKDVII